MVDPSLYNPISMPNKYDYLKAAGDEAYNREKAERSARGSGIGSIIGTVLGAASFLIPGVGVPLGLGIMGAAGSVGGAFGGLTGGRRAKRAEEAAIADATGKYDQNYGYLMSERTSAIEDAINEARSEMYTDRIQSMRRNVIPSSAEYLKFV